MLKVPPCQNAKNNERNDIVFVYHSPFSLSKRYTSHLYIERIIQRILYIYTFDDVLYTFYRCTYDALSLCSPTLRTQNVCINTQSHHHHNSTAPICILYVYQHIMPTIHVFQALPHSIARQICFYLLRAGRLD